jgi:mRNA interferase MazF
VVAEPKKDSHVKRGEIWSVSGGPDYAGKPRPAIIIQSDKFDATCSVTVCPLTGTPVEAIHARLPLMPSEGNGLRVRSYAMVDKVTTIPRSKIGNRIGLLDRSDVSLLDQRLALFIGLAD